MKKTSAPPLAPASEQAPGRQRRQRVQAAETGVAVLKGLARLGGRASLTALAAHVDESPAKVHRYLVSLIEEDMVQQDPNSQQYYLGLQTLLAGVAALRQADPIRLAEPALVRLRETLEITCFIAVMGNKGPTIVRFEEPGLPVTVNVRVGSVLPLLWSATGRAFLAQLDEAKVQAQAEQELGRASAEQRKLLARTDPIGALRREVLAAGCASVCDTNLKGISAVAAPILDYTARPCAVLTALGATGGFNAAADGPIAEAVRREAKVISTSMGFVRE